MGQLALGHAGSWTVYTDEDLDETKIEVKAAPAYVGGWHLYNDSSAVHYVLLYDALATNVTVGTTAAKLTIGVAANSSASLELPKGIAFETALTVACTTNFATGAPSANDCVANVLYY
jgi:hypothetical protein